MRRADFAVDIRRDVRGLRDLDLSLCGMGSGSERGVGG
jgi:hypothetical protein